MLNAQSLGVRRQPPVRDGCGKVLSSGVSQKETV